MGWLSFLSGQGVEGCYMDHFDFWEGISTSAGQIDGLGVGKCWQAKVAGERVFMDHLERKEI